MYGLELEIYGPIFSLIEKMKTLVREICSLFDDSYDL